MNHFAICNEAIMVTNKHSVAFLCLCSILGILAMICFPSILPWPQFPDKLFNFRNNSSFLSYYKIRDGGPIMPTEINFDYKEARNQTIEYLENMSSNFSHYKINKPYSVYFSYPKVSVCLIMKNGHSVIRFVNCLLNIKESGTEKEYNEFDSLLTFKGAWSPKCSKIRAKTKKSSNNYTKIVFVRNPLERFISGWLFLCQRDKACWNCGLDVGCFLNTLYMCWRTNKTYSKICNYNSPSLESKHNFSGHIYSHMFPQVTFCDLLHKRQEYKVIDYSTENINNFLMSAAKPMLRSGQYTKLIGRLNQKTIHAANEHDAEDVEAIIRSNRTLTRMFAQLYFMDYKIFEIDIPQFIVDFKLHENDN